MHKHEYTHTDIHAYYTYIHIHTYTHTIIHAYIHALSRYLCANEKPYCDLIQWC